MKKLIPIVILIGLLIAGCQPPENETRTPIPVKDRLPLYGEQQAADDIVPVPGGGPAYRGNVHQEGQENPWSPIEVSETYLGSGADEAHVYYRSHIETAPGETRNNVIKAIVPGKEVSSLRLYANDIPQGITLTDGMQWSGPSARASVLVIEIAPDVAPGQYPLETGLEINGKDYGTVECTIEVIELSIEQSVVKVFETGESQSPKALGVIVGSGNQVLTVLDYEEYTPAPGTLEVVTPTGNRFSVSVQAIDPRTSATLLLLEGANLQPVRVGDSANLETGQQVCVQGWKSGTTFKKAQARITYLSDWPLDFHVNITEEAILSGNFRTQDKGTYSGTKY
ncbi:MAG: hypothetical protein ACLFVA_06380 [Dehalococcoidia bacterium]